MKGVANRNAKEKAKKKKLDGIDDVDSVVSIFFLVFFSKKTLHFFVFAAASMPCRRKTRYEIKKKTTKSSNTRLECNGTETRNLKKGTPETLSRVVSIKTTKKQRRLFSLRRKKTKRLENGVCLLRKKKEIIPNKSRP